ncbi:MAG: hypothetical protein K2X27_01905 [Candidatus Obscuribacterales bacterium]|nr:hypothetical protein [Candidatus Obscuribacterales bacterium]
MLNLRFVPRIGRGSIMPFIIACAFVLIIVGLGLFTLSQIMGGNFEFSSAVDSGALSVGQQVFTLKTDLKTADRDEMQYADVAENSKSFSLSSINRLWAKCLLVQLNAASMKNLGQSTGDSDSHASQIYRTAYEIEDRLYKVLSDGKSIEKFFDDMVSKESVRMLGEKASIKADEKEAAKSNGGWKSARMDQGVESNISVSANQLPPGFSLEKLGTTQADDKKYYFKGYEAIKGANLPTLCFVPFKLNAQPHLVSAKDFEKTDSTIKGVTSNPLPNAFSCQAVSVNQKFSETKGKSYVLTNPRKTYEMSMPHAFVKIVFENNIAHWNLNVTAAQNNGNSNSGKIVGAGIKNGTVPVANGGLAPRFGSGAGLISQDGAGLISQDGAGLISQDGAGLISQDGAGLISQDGAGLISQDGAGLISQDGAGLISQDGAGLISQDGAGLAGRGRHLMSLEDGPQTKTTKNGSPDQKSAQNQSLTQSQTASLSGATASVYGLKPEQQNRTYKVGKDIVQIQAFLGNEYNPSTLRQGIFALNGIYSAITAALCQRIREIKPSFKDTDLNGLLESCALTQGSSEYIIFLDPNGDLKAQAKSQARQTSSWLKADNGADGAIKQISSDSAPTPNRATVTPESYKAAVRTYGEIYWKPGTGYDDCLGEMHVQRQSDINITN